MAAITETSPITPTVNKVSEEDYLEKYAADFYELVDGELVSIMPSAELYDMLFRILIVWFETFLLRHPIADLRVAPFVMRIPNQSHREPDLQIILNEHADRLTKTYTDGAADLVVEIVSEESTSRDYGDKFQEYETGGVREYWIIDPIRREARFYVLDDEGHYHHAQLDARNVYTSTVLPGLQLPINLLWTEPLPRPMEVARQMTAFLESSSE
jgi:Uma2 family endonuclease